MDFNQLELFLKVAQLGSFDRAANELYISQRAVSRKIKNLENELGFELFERTSNRIKLNASGKYLVPKIQEHLNSFNTTLETAYAISQQQAAQLRIGYFSVFDGMLMRDHILNYQKSQHQPQISFTTIEESVEHLLADIELKKLDCGYINHYGKYNQLSTEIYKFINVFSGEMLLGISKENPLSQKDFVEENDLIGQKLLYYSEESSDYMKDTFLNTFSDNIAKFNVQRVSSIEQLMIDCSLNNGLAYVTKGLFEKFMIPDKNIIFKPIHSRKINQKYQMQLFYRKDNQSPTLKSFIQSIQENL